MFDGLVSEKGLRPLFPSVPFSRHTGKLDKRYSKILHKMFDVRQQSDYRELVELTEDDARESVSLAKEYIMGVPFFAFEAIEDTVEGVNNEIL